MSVASVVARSAGVATTPRTPGAPAKVPLLPLTVNTTSPVEVWTPSLYVGGDGDLNREFWINNVTPIKSSVSVADGKWHHVVLSASAASQTLYLDGNGDATVVGSQTMIYDSTDRVTGIKNTAGGVTQSVVYSLDADDRLIARIAAGTGAGTENSTTIYGYAGSGSSADLQLSSGGVLAERYLSLPGGVLLTRRYTTIGGDVWSIPSLRGNVIATTGPTGTILNSGELYDPYGQPVDAASGATNPAATATTRTNGLADAWHGQSQVGYEHSAGLNDTLMGARLYLPAWGQFTATDPVPGGNANPYMYPADPINAQDLTGTFGWSSIGHALKSAVNYAKNPWNLVDLCADFAPSMAGIACGIASTIHTCVTESTGSCVSSGIATVAGVAVGGGVARAGLKSLKTAGEATKELKTIRGVPQMVSTSARKVGVSAPSYVANVVTSVTVQISIAAPPAGGAALSGTWSGRW